MVTKRDRPGCIVILYPGDRAARDRADPSESRFRPLFDALAEAGIDAEPAVYHDDFVNEVRAQLLDAEAVLVWHNPIEGGRTRQVLDAMLLDVDRRGVFVSAHPDTILKLGTKDVLLAVKDLPFGSDAWRVERLDDVGRSVVGRLASGPRVLKQHRGHSGQGVWRIEAESGTNRFLLRHAQRGAVEERVDLQTLLARLSPYFQQGGHMIDQAWQPRLQEGMVRAYLVRDRVAGFGHQAINALYPAGNDTPPEPGPRLYSGPEDARFQWLRRRLEQEWVAMLCASTDVAADRLPLLWDADFFLGRPDGDTERYVLCEINVSSVSPYPPSATPLLVDAVSSVVATRRERSSGN